MKIQQQNEEHRQMKINEDHNIKNEQQHKNLLEVFPSKYHRWELLTFDYKLKKKYISKHNYKNYVNSWCFNNKNAFTAIRVVYINGGSGQKTLKWLV